METQANLFSDKICEHCGKNPGFRPDKPQLWNGFYDADTKQYFCFDCRREHYIKKQKTDFANQYSEMPVVL